LVLKDNYGRPLLGLRITLTHRCNYDCIYCHREGEEGGGELTVDEIKVLAKAASELGIKKFKLTGGEPLIRTDIIEVISAIASVKPLDLSLTTNGYFLAELAKDLRKAGLMRVNVSLPSLREEVYKRITNVNGLDKVLEGLEEASRVDLRPIKLNVVLLKGLNQDEVWDIVNYAKSMGFIVQLIELEPLGKATELFKRLHLDLTLLEEEVKAKAVGVHRRRHMNNRPQYLLKGGGIIEFVRPIHSGEFCMYCTRLRVTAMGYLKPCIMRNDNLVPIKEALSKGDIKGVKEAIIKANYLRRPYFTDLKVKGEG